MKTVVSGIAALVTLTVALVFRFSLNTLLGASIYSGRRFYWVGPIRIDNTHAMMIAAAVGLLVFASVQYILYWKPFGLAISVLACVLSLHLARQLPLAEMHPLTPVKLFVGSASGLTVLTWIAFFKPWRDWQARQSAPNSRVPHEVGSSA